MRSYAQNTAHSIPLLPFSSLHRRPHSGPFLSHTLLFPLLHPINPLSHFLHSRHLRPRRLNPPPLRRHALKYLLQSFVLLLPFYLLHLPRHLLRFPTPRYLFFFFAFHAVEAGVMTAPVAVETGGCFEGVDHEAVAGAGGDHGGFLRTGAARWGVCHLLMKEQLASGYAG